MATEKKTPISGEITGVEIVEKTYEFCDRYGTGSGVEIGSEEKTLATAKTPNSDEISGVGIVEDTHEFVDHSGLGIRLENCSEEKTVVTAKTRISGEEIVEDTPEFVDHSGLGSDDLLCIVFRNPILKCFYKEASKISALTPAEVMCIRAGMNLHVEGIQIPKPIQHWFQGGLMTQILNALKFEEPTSVQRQCLPILMSGRDAVVYGPTKSGKRVSYVLPLIRHVYNLKRRLTWAPLGLIIVPSWKDVLTTCKIIKDLGKDIEVKPFAVYNNTFMESFENIAFEDVDILVCPLDIDIDLSCIVQNALDRITFLVLHGQDLLGRGLVFKTNQLVKGVSADCQLAVFASKRTLQTDMWCAKRLKNHIVVEVMAGLHAKKAKEVAEKELLEEFLKQFKEDGDNNSSYE